VNKDFHRKEPMLMPMLMGFLQSTDDANWLLSWYPWIFHGLQILMMLITTVLMRR